MKFNFLLNNKIVFFLTYFVLLVPILFHNSSWYFVLPSVLCLVFLVDLDFDKFFWKSAIDGWLILGWFFYLLVSSLWAYNGEQVVSTFINQIFKPMVCFFSVSWLIRNAKLNEKNIGSIFLFLGATIFIVSLVCLVIGGKEALWMAFYDLGYYSTFIVIISAACVPFLDNKIRLLFYPIVAFLFFLTDQRVVWIIYPFLFVTDILVSSKKLVWKHFIILFTMLMGSYFVLKYLQGIRPADAFKVIDNQKSLSLIDYLLKNERLIAWKEWIKRGCAHPYFGVGFGKENTIQYFSSKEVWNISKLYHAHNIFLNAFVQTGLVGLGLMLSAYGYLLHKLMKFFNDKVAISIFLVLLFFIFRNQFDCFDSKRIIMVYFSILGVGYGYLARIIYIQREN